MRRFTTVFVLFASTLPSFADGQPADAVESNAQELTEWDEIRSQNARELERFRRELQAEYQQQLEEVQVHALHSAISSFSVPSSAFMPPAYDASSLFTNETKRTTTNLGAGIRIPRTNLLFRAAIDGGVNAWFDTGRVGSGARFDPSTIAIRGSSAQGAGLFSAAAFNGTLKLDLEAELSEEEQAQAYLETDVVDDDLQVRHVFGRVIFSTVNVLAGSYWTTWGDEAAIPKSIIPSGTPFPVGVNALAGVPQLRLAFPTESGWVTTIAIQQPISGDIGLRTGMQPDVALQRYPDFAARVRYFDDDYFSMSIGTLVRILGNESTAGDEDFTPGWGVSASTRFRVPVDGALLFGFTGGQGIARSIFGLSDSLAAVTQTDGDLASLVNYGAYAGYQREWSDFMSSTVAYGFAHSEGRNVDPGRTRTTQNAWVNLIHQVNDNFAYGVQYDYGDRQLLDSRSGENHRFSLVVSVVAGQNDKADGQPAPSRFLGGSLGLATPNEGAAMPSQLLPQDSGVSRFSRQ